MDQVLAVAQFVSRILGCEESATSVQQLVRGVCANMLCLVFACPGLTCPEDADPQVFWIVLMPLCKPELRCHDLFKGRRLSPGNHTCSVISSCAVMLTCNMLTGACTVGDVGLVSVPRSTAQPDLGGVPGLPLLGLWHCVHTQTFYRDVKCI